MARLFGNYINDYEDIHFQEKIHDYEIYIAYNLKEKRDVSLKLIKKELFKDKTLLKKQMENEKNILKKLSDSKSKNILKLYRDFETEENIIFEQEYYDTNLREYIMNNGPADYKKDFFKEIVIGFTKALEELYKNKIMHRNIRSSSLFLIEKNGKNEIKLGEFSTAIYIKDNVSEPLNSIYYTAPEIVNGQEYNEKCDIWSFAITLYELYFGKLPYGFKPSKHIVIKAISEEKLNLEKTNIQPLDYILENSLKIKPEERLSHETLFEIVFNSDFMNENQLSESTIIKKNSSGSNNLPFINKSSSGSICLNNSVSSNNSISLNNSIISSNSINLKNSYKNEKKFNNILYYNENKSYKKSIYKECEHFEVETPGGFILCTSMNNLELVKKEILKEYNNNNKKIKFNLICTGKQFEDVYKFIEKDDDFKNCFNDYCIFCYNLKKYDNYKNKYQNKVHNDIYRKEEDIIKFIKRTSSSTILPFKINQIITYYKYQHKFQIEHINLENFSMFSNKENYENYLNNMVELLSRENKSKLVKNKDALLEGLKNIMSSFYRQNYYLIIKEFFDTVNDNIKNLIIDSAGNTEECLLYFSSLIMNSLSYLDLNYIWENKNKKFYMGANLFFTELSQYERAKGNKIYYPYFTIFYDDKELVEELSNRNKTQKIYEENLKYSVIYTLENEKYNNIIFGLDGEKLGFKRKNSIIFKPYTCFLLKTIEINLINYSADIVLEII